MSLSANAQSEIYLIERSDDSGYVRRVIGVLDNAKRLASLRGSNALAVLGGDGAIRVWDVEQGWSAAAGIMSAISVDAGMSHFVAVDRDGNVWTWGANEQGQLGDGGLVSRSEARAISGIRDAVRGAAGSFYTLVLLRDGTVLAMGSNWSGVVTGDARKIVTEPTRVVGLDQIAEIAVVGDVPYARDTQGRVWSWSDAAGPRVVDAKEIERLGAELDSRLADAPGSLAAEYAGVAFDGAVIDFDAGVAVAAIVGRKSLSAEPAQESQNDDTQQASRRHPMSSWIGARSSTSATGRLAAAQNHSLTIGSDGILYGSGYNISGQLGDGTILHRRRFVRTAVINQAVSVSSNMLYSLAVRSDGSVWGWGAGLPGNQSPVLNLVPFRLPSLIGFISAAAGFQHALALKSDGTVWTWGDNQYGQLGDGTTASRATPAQVPSLGSVVAIAAGRWSSVALRSDGTVWVWGYNFSGSLGGPENTPQLIPWRVIGIDGVIAIASGEQHVLALKSDGTVWAWGDGQYGKLGYGGWYAQSTPVQALGLADVVAIAAGSEHSMAVRNDGTVWTWGDGFQGQLGDGAQTNRPIPVQATGIGSAIAVAGGRNHSLALLGDGSLVAWGSNDAGQLGVPAVTGVLVPFPVASPDPGIYASPGNRPPSNRLSANQGHALSIRHDGTVWSWGYNYSGQLGDGTTTTRFTPVRVLGLTNVVQVSAGVEHGLAVRGDGSLWGWGRNINGRLGNAALAQLAPASLSGFSGIVSVAAGDDHTLALRDDGKVLAMGRNHAGQLGDGTYVSRSTPGEVNGINDVVAIAAGTTVSVALRRDGTVWIWGTDLIEDPRTPVILAGLTDVVSISAASGLGLALRRDGTLWSWGYGWLGYGGSASIRLARVADLTEVVAISAGPNHSLAVRRDGSVWGWGNGYWGQLGFGSGPSYSEIPVRAQMDGALFAVAGSRNSLALQSGGSIWAWGANDFGQFGAPSPEGASLPTRTLLNFVAPHRIGTFAPNHGTWLVDSNANYAWDGSPPDLHTAFGAPGMTPVLGDWNGDGRKKIGVFDPANGAWLLDYNGNGVWDGPVTDRAFFWGGAGHKPVAGNWNGTGGTDKVGVYDPATSTFLLDYNGNFVWEGGSTDRMVSWGSSGDVPVIGDWNGTGTAKIGVFNSSQGWWVIDFNGNFDWDGAGTDRFVRWGSPGDIPVVGDWNASGRAKLGSFNSAQARWLLDYDGNYLWDGGVADQTFLWGSPGDIPVVGDWNVSGTAKAGAVSPSQGVWVLDYNGNTVWDGLLDRLLRWGSPGDTPVPGIW